MCWTGEMWREWNSATPAEKQHITKRREDARIGSFLFSMWRHMSDWFDPLRTRPLAPTLTFAAEHGRTGDAARLHFYRHSDPAHLFRLWFAYAAASRFW